MKPAPLAAPYHDGVRRFARVAGPLLLGLGGIFMIVGFVDFFTAASHFGPPTLFWCFFVGMPFLFFGGVFCQIGYMGAAARYAAAETAPVAADTFNYLAEETRPGVARVAGAVAQGLAETDESQTVAARLRQLEELRKNALVTEAEYAEQRRRILGEL